MSQDPSEASDRDLVSRCRTERSALQAAFGELYQRHSGTAYHYLAGLLGSRGAPDALQETFLRVYRNLERYDPERPFRAWVLGIARHVALDQLRREGARPLEPLESEPPHPARGPQERASASEQDALLRAAVAALPTGERVALLLRQVEGLSIAEVARELGIAERTVHYRLRQAAERLAQDLRRRGLISGGAP